MTNKQNNKNGRVKVAKEIPYDRLKCLLVASYLLGQEMGLMGYTYSHKDCVRQRENIIKFIFNGEIMDL